MNINQVKGLSWALFAVVTTGLGYNVYDFLTVRRLALDEFGYTPGAAREILDSAEKPEVQKSSSLQRDAVRRAFEDLNWTGRAPLKHFKPEDPEDQEAEPDCRPMTELIQVQLIMADARVPEHGRAWIAYMDGAGVPKPSQEHSFAVKIRVGDKLAKPHDYATVKSITLEKGVTFVFDDEERSEESINAAPF